MTTLHEYAFWAKVVAIYTHLWILDQIDYYAKYLTLTLPAYVFGSPVIRIRQSCSDDSDEEDSSTDFCVFIAHLMIVTDVDDRIESRELHGAQLRPFVEEDGRLLIGELAQYFPNLSMIYIRYAKTPLDGGDVRTSKMLIDVKKKYDNYNQRSCRFGTVF